MSTLAFYSGSGIIVGEVLPAVKNEISSPPSSSSSIVLLLLIVVLATAGCHHRWSKLSLRRRLASRRLRVMFSNDDLVVNHADLSVSRSPVKVHYCSGQWGSLHQRHGELLKFDDFTSQLSPV
ncbi:unnamed protein product [Linum trigynum]|uniref:Uncharacterized protein n=1 Tax=Linum trigynum TaxID=586398 RepID=A0AAV2GAC9_9ROSI